MLHGLRKAYPHAKKAWNKVQDYKKQRYINRTKVMAAESASKRRKFGGSLGQQIHSGSGSRSCTVSLGSAKHAGRTLGRFNMLVQTGGIFSSNAGLQSVYTVACGGTFSQILTSTAAPTIAQGPVSYYDMNPYRKVTGSNHIGNAIPSNDKVVLVQQHIKLNIANMESASCTVFVYVMSAKKNHSTHFDFAMVDGLNADALGNTAQTLNAPGVTAGAVVGLANYGVVGMKPQMSSTFRSLFKVHKVIRLNLGAGAEEEINVVAKVNRMLDRLFLSNQSGTNIYVGNTSIVLGIIQYGQIVDDVTISNAATFGSSRIGIVQTMRTTLAAVKDNAARINFQEALTQLPVGAAVNKQNIVNSVDVVDFIKQS